jgi:hypothetical protein
LGPEEAIKMMSEVRDEMGHQASWVFLADDVGRLL